MTLKEIAKEAGVSPSTVSRIINKKGGNVAGKQVQERVWDIVRRSGYVPNQTARSLKLGKEPREKDDARTLACLFARAPSAVSDPFFSQIARSFESEAFKQNFVLKYSFSSVDITRPEVMETIAIDKTDGIAILGRCDRALLCFLKGCYRYVIYAGLNMLDADYDQIICDGMLASRTAVEHLIKLGHTNIGYVGETENEVRFNGYRQALFDHSLHLGGDYVSNVILSCEGGYEGMKKLIKRAPGLTAAFCSNDQTSIGAVHAVHELGLKIPDDISIISIDDIDAAQYLSPMLTTVHIPVEEMGQMAAKILIDRILGGHKLPMRVNLPFYLVVRESCAPPKAR